MKQAASPAYPGWSIVQQLVGQVPWGHNKPIGVAEWQTRLVESLPQELKGSLPTIEELEAELSGRKESRKK